MQHYRDYYVGNYKMDDLYPSEMEVLLGSLIVLLREEKDVDTQINANNEDIKNRVKNEIMPADAQAELDISQCMTTDLTEHMPVNRPAEPPPSQQSEQAEPKSAEPQGPELESAEAPSADPSPLVKKLFKQIALHTHPDKVKDERLNKFFLLGRKAQEQNDILTLLFILSKCPSKDILDHTDLVAIKPILDERQNNLTKKKNSFTYKWNTYAENIKQTLIKKIIV